MWPCRYRVWVPNEADCSSPTFKRSGRLLTFGLTLAAHATACEAHVFHASFVQCQHTALAAFTTHCAPDHSSLNPSEDSHSDQQTLRVTDSHADAGLHLQI